MSKPFIKAVPFDGCRNPAKDSGRSITH